MAKKSKEVAPKWIHGLKCRCYECWPFNPDSRAGQEYLDRLYDAEDAERRATATAGLTL